MYFKILKCTFYAILGGFVLSVIFAFFYRLPIPFAEMIGPFGEVSSNGFFSTFTAVLGAWAIYGFVFGGLILYFLICSMLCIALRDSLDKPETMKKLTYMSVFLGFIPVLAVTHLDIIIGPW